MAKFLITIATGPDEISSSRSAYKFATAALEQHQLLGVFFWQDGVLTGLAQQQPAGDEWHALESWQALSADFDVPLICCSTAALRRGVLSQEEADDASVAPTLAAGFRIGGLGELVVLSNEADRVVQF